jgi:hypothetical protein
MTILVRDAGKNWQVLAYTRTWTSAFAAYISIFTTNNAASNAVSSCRLRSFLCPPGILFDTEPAITTAASFNDIKLTVPERRSYLTAKVPITVFTYAGVLGTRNDAFEYIRPEQRVLTSDTVRVTSTSLKQDRISIYADVISIYGPRIGQPDVTGVGNVGVGTPPPAIATRLSLVDKTKTQYSVNGSIFPTIMAILTDDLGQMVLGANDIVTLNVITAPVGAIFTGTMAKQALGGSVSFNDLRLSGSKVGPYVLRVTSPTLASDETVAFTVQFLGGKPFINLAGLGPTYRHNAPF